MSSRDVLIDRIEASWPLLDWPRWWLWQARPRAGSARPRKVPVRVSSGGRLIPHHAMDPRAWRPWADVRADHLAGHGDGVGIALGAGLVCIDVDECVNASGELDPFASSLVARLDGYVERSPAGGLHVLGWAGAALPPGNRRAGRVELLRNGFITVTGDVLLGRSPHPVASPLLYAVWTELAGTPPPRHAPPGASSGVVDPVALVATASRLRNAGRFLALWNGHIASHPSPSEADFALCRHLFFLLGPDEVAIDAAFRASGLYHRRPANWHRTAQCGPPALSYGQLTVRRAVTCGGSTLHRPGGSS